MEHLFAPWCYPRWIQPGLPPHLDRTDNNRGKHLYRKCGASVCGQCQCVLLGTCASSELSHCLADKMQVNTQPWIQEADIACPVDTLKFWGFFHKKCFLTKNCCPFWICHWLERGTPFSLQVISRSTSKIKMKHFHCHIKEILSSA